MKNTKIISGISAFAMIFGLGVNYISAEETNTIIYGDLDGDGIPQINDLIEMSLNLLGDKPFTEEQKKAADVNGDGCFDIADLSTMRQFIMHDDIELGKPLDAVQTGKNEDDFDISKCKIISDKSLYLTGYNMYRLENKDQISMVIDSEEKFTEFKEFCKNDCSDSFELIKSGINISGDFFKDNTLFIIARQEENGNIKAGISDIDISKQRGISFEITSNYSQQEYSIGIHTWLHAAAIPNKYLDGIDTSQIKIKNKGTAAEDNSVLNYLDLQSCDTLNYQTRGYYDFLPFDDDEFKMSAVIKSEEDFNKYNKQFNSTTDKLKSYFGLTEEFFNENTLFIIPVTERYGSIDDKITDVEMCSDNKLYITYTSTVPFVNTCDIATWHLAVAVPNKFLTGKDTTDFKVIREVKQQKDIPDDDVLDLSDCEKIDCPAPFYYDDNFYYDKYINQFLITSKEELYEYNKCIKFVTDLVRPQRDNWEDMLDDNVMVSIDCFGHSGVIRHSITGISVDENNKISVDLTVSTPECDLTCDFRRTHLCLLVPRKYLNTSSAEPTLEVIRHDVVG